MDEPQVDLSVLYREDATEDEKIEVYQYLINTGDVWKLEGVVAQTARHLIDDGLCVLGQDPARDFWGATIPAYYMVKEGPGSVEYCLNRHPERFDDDETACCSSCQTRTFTVATDRDGRCIRCEGMPKFEKLAIVEKR